MSQKYVTDGAWLICSEGTMMQKLKVESQTTTYMHNKLAATEIDRTGENFNCTKMMAMGALIGAAIAAAAVAATVLTGGAFIGVMAAAGAVGGGAFAGAVAGKLVSFIPCGCSLLTKPNPWITPYEKTWLAGKQALLEDAVRPCLLGGMVSIVKTDIDMAIDMTMISDDVYHDESRLDESVEWERVEEFEGYPEGLKESDLWKDGDGFRARLYINKEGRYVVAFKGTYEREDVSDDVIQALGFESEQYTRADKLAEQIRTYLPPHTMITGHSLGGGLAALAGARTGLETYTYNAAGVHRRTFERYNIDSEDAEHVNAYSSDDDPLSIAQDNREIIISGLLSKFGNIGKLMGLAGLDGALPRASGQRIGLETDEIPMTAHGIDPMTATLREEQKASPTINVRAEKR